MPLLLDQQSDSVQRAQEPNRSKSDPSRILLAASLDRLIAESPSMMDGAAVSVSVIEGNICSSPMEPVLFSYRVVAAPQDRSFRGVLMRARFVSTVDREPSYLHDNTAKETASSFFGHRLLWMQVANKVSKTWNVVTISAEASRFTSVAEYMRYSTLRLK